MFTSAGVALQLYFVANTLSIFTMMAVFFNLQGALLALWNVKRRFYDVYG